MKFKIIYQNGKEKIIRAKSLDDAENKANEKIKSWTDIYIIGEKYENNN